MTTTGDREWGELATTWQRTAELGAERLVRAMVIRQSRLMRVILFSEVVLTIAILGLVGYFVARQPTRAMIGWGIAAVLHSALVWGFSLWNRRGVWRPLGESTRAYLTLAIERATREGQAARFVIGLVLVEAAAIVALIAWSGVPVTGWSWAVPATVVVTALAWAVWRLVRSLGKLARLRRIGRDLELEPATDTQSTGVVP